MALREQGARLWAWLVQKREELGWGTEWMEEGISGQGKGGLWADWAVPVWGCASLRLCLPNSGCEVSSDLCLQTQIRGIHWGVWCLPYGKGINVLSHHGSSCLPKAALDMAWQTGLAVPVLLRIALWLAFYKDKEQKTRRSCTSTAISKTKQFIQGKLYESLSLYTSPCPYHGWLVWTIC